MLLPGHVLLSREAEAPASSFLPVTNGAINDGHQYQGNKARRGSPWLYVVYKR